MADLRDDFRHWLIKQGLSEKTKTGRAGTVYEYARRIDNLCNKIYKDHSIQSWQKLAENIYPILGLHLICRKGEMHIAKDEFAKIDIFIKSFESQLNQYKENFKDYFIVKFVFDENNISTNYNNVVELLIENTPPEITIFKISDSIIQINKNRNALEKFYQFLLDIRCSDAISCCHNNIAEREKVDNFYNDLTKKIQVIKSFEIAPSNIFELIVNGGNNCEPPLFDVSETKVASAWVCSLLRIERHTLSNIKALKPTSSSKRYYLIKDVNEFISKNFVKAKNSPVNLTAVKKWWTVKEAIEKTGLSSNQIKYLRKEAYVSYVKVTDKIYIFYPYDFAKYAKNKFIVDDKL